MYIYFAFAVVSVLYCICEVTEKLYNGKLPLQHNLKGHQWPSNLIHPLTNAFMQIFRQLGILQASWLIAIYHMQDIFSFMCVNAFYSVYDTYRPGKFYRQVIVTACMVFK